jgi:hypothetical protein
MDNSEVTKDIHSNHHLFTEKRIPGIHQYRDISNHALQDKKDIVALHMVLLQLQSQRWFHPQKTHQIQPESFSCNQSKPEFFIKKKKQNKTLNLKSYDLCIKQQNLLQLDM